VIAIDGKPWFVAADVCKTLGLTNSAKAVQNLTSGDVQDYRVPGTRGRMNKIINEPGLYRLVMRSDKAEAQVFQDWGGRDVLPAITKIENLRPWPQRCAVGVIKPSSPTGRPSGQHRATRTS
jgi:prophage antirepressor-like protein